MMRCVQLSLQCALYYVYVRMYVGVTVVYTLLLGVLYILETFLNWRMRDGLH